MYNDFITRHPKRTFNAPLDLSAPGAVLPQGNTHGAVIGLQPEVGRRGTGLHLGHTGINPQAFRDAARAGHLPDFLLQHRRAMNAVNARAQDPRFSNIAGAWMRLSNQQAANLKDPNNQPGAVNTGLPGNNLPGSNDLTQPKEPFDRTPPIDFGLYHNLINNYDPGFGEMGNSYFRNLNKGLIDQPSFDEMFGSYRNVAQGEANRQMVDMNEALGSRGNRYGSAILNAQGANSRDLYNDLLNHASQYQSQLRGQQFQEFQPFMSLEDQHRAAGMANMYNTYTQNMQPSPFLNPATSYATSFGQPGYAIQ